MYCNLVAATHAQKRLSLALELPIDVSMAPKLFRIVRRLAEERGE